MNDFHVTITIEACLGHALDTLLDNFGENLQLEAFLDDLRHTSSLLRGPLA